ncbi:hypothetical protein N332_05844, partial [Mesitornis unicolor]
KGAPVVPAKGGAVAASLGAAGSPRGQPALPRRKPLPHVKTLGARPAKPRRPPAVDLGRFGEAACPGMPIHPAMEPPRRAQPGLPNHCLPHRREEDEVYDDVEPIGLLRRGQGFPLPPVSQPPAYPRCGGGG